MQLNNNKTVLEKTFFVTQFAIDICWLSYVLVLVLTMTTKTKSRKRGNNSFIDVKCRECKCSIGPEERHLACVCCASRFHTDCAQVTRLEYVALKKNKKMWLCSDECETVFNKANHNSDKVDIPDNPSNRDILLAIQELKQSQGFLSDKYDLLTGKIDSAVKRFEALDKRITTLEKENVSLKSQLSKQQNSDRQDNSHNLQKDLLCNIILSGVPNEVADVPDAVMKVATFVDDAFTQANILKAERLFEPTAGKADKKVIDKIPIVITMVSETAKVDLVKSFRKKVTVLAEEAGIPGGQSKLIFKEHMTSFNVKLMQEAKKRKQDGKLKFVWFQNSSVLVRKDETSKIVKVTSPQDLLQFDWKVLFFPF